jgi:hypothetical protein
MGEIGSHDATFRNDWLREDMCIGAGARPHYRDRSAPDSAEKLDDLIKR